MEKSAVSSGDSVWITGRVVDHAYKPVAGAEIHLRIGSRYRNEIHTHSEGQFESRI